MVAQIVTAKRDGETLVKRAVLSLSSGGVMRHFRKGLITLIASTAVLVPAGMAGADEQNGLVNVYVEDVLTHNQVVLLQNVSVPVAANVCGTQASVLSAALLQAQKVTCAAKSNSLQKAWVSYD